MELLVLRLLGLKRWGGFKGPLKGIYIYLNKKWEKLLIVFDFSYICKRRNAEDFLRSNFFFVWSGGGKTGQNSPYFVREHPVGCNRMAKTPTKSDAWTIKQQLSFVEAYPGPQTFLFSLNNAVFNITSFTIPWGMLLNAHAYKVVEQRRNIQLFSNPVIPSTQPWFSPLILFLIFYQTTWGFVWTTSMINLDHKLGVCTFHLWSPSVPGPESLS